MRTKQDTRPGPSVRFAVWVFACAFGTAALYAETTVTLELLGDLPGGEFNSSAAAVSADGLVVVGGSVSDSSFSNPTASYGVEPFRWENGSMLSFGDLPGESSTGVATGVSADGSVMVGVVELPDGSGNEGFRLENGTWTNLGDLPGGELNTLAFAVSADGSVVVGYSESSLSGRAFRWEGGIMEDLGDLPGGESHSVAEGVSADGAVVVGRSWSSSSDSEAFRWKDGTMIGLGDLPGGGFYSWATGASADGSVVVGSGTTSSGHEAFRWENGVMVGLSDLPGGSFSSMAGGVSGDGKVVVGTSDSGHRTNPYGYEAVFWSEENGWEPVSLNDFLDSEGIGRNGYALEEATAISSDGTTIVGRGRHPNGDQEAFRARIVETSSPVQGYELAAWGAEHILPEAPLSGIKAISIGSGHCLALNIDGSITTWAIGQFIGAPTGNDFVAIAAGQGHGLGLRKDGSIVGWGGNEHGEATPPVGNDYVAIAASIGAYHSLALKSDGSIVGWGRNENGEASPPSGNDFIAISAGANHSLALRNDGSIVGWGGFPAANVPTGNDFVAISAGDGGYSLALKADGSIVGWGCESNCDSSPPLGNDFVAISAGGSYYLALRSNGTIVGWGSNDITPPDGYSYVAIAASFGGGLALKIPSIPPVLEILQPPQSLTAAPGSTVTFTVATSGIEGESFQWKRGDTNIGGDSATLTLTNILPAHAGQYTVTVTDGEDSVSSRSVTLGVKAPPYTEKMMNISTRGQVLTGTKIMIAGFVLQGTGSKDVLIRGIGPTLGSFGVPGTVTDPMLELFRSTDPNTAFEENDDWGTASGDIAAVSQRVGAFALGDGSKDAALVMSLDPGAFTAQVSGMDGTGVGLVELYDADQDPTATTCTLVNISTRGEVGVDSEILIAGFVIDGEVPKQVLVRGIGPRLADFQVAGSLADPYLRILKNVETDQLWVASNDNWSDNPNAAEIISTSTTVGAFGLTDGSKDAVMLTWLEPGVYTAQVSGVGETTGVALVEVYEVK